MQKNKIKKKGDFGNSNPVTSTIQKAIQFMLNRFFLFSKC